MSCEGGSLWPIGTPGDEAQLKTTLGERRAEVLKDKRILLLRQLIADSGHSDLSLPDDLARGFDLTGKLPPSIILR